MHKIKSVDFWVRLTFHSLVINRTVYIRFTIFTSSIFPGHQQTTNIHYIINCYIAYEY